MPEKISAFSSLVDGLKGEFDQATINKILQNIVNNVGGERVYVPVKIDVHIDAIRETPESIQRKYNVSKRTAYRWINRHRI